MSTQASELAATRNTDRVVAHHDCEPLVALQEASQISSIDSSLHFDSVDAVSPCSWNGIELPSQESCAMDNSCAKCGQNLGDSLRQLCGKQVCLNEALCEQ
jgi:hypothetical protein